MNLNGPTAAITTAAASSSTSSSKGPTTSLTAITNNHGPAIPLRTSARTSSSTSTTPTPNNPNSKESKRRSLPASPLKDLRRSSNHVSVKPASPEVISSLIDTLSAISSPVKDHFDSFPEAGVSVSTPVSPSPWNTNFPGVGKGVGGRRDGLLHPERASIRDSSGTSRRSSNGLNAKSSEDEYSIGNVSIESHSPKPLQSSASLASLGSESKGKRLRSIRSLRSLAMRGSKDSFNNPSAPQSPRSPGFWSRRESDMGRPQERLIISESPSPSPPLNRTKDLDIPKRNSRTVTSDVVISPTRTSIQRDSKRLFLNGDDFSDDPNSSKRNSFQLPSQDLIPKRNSSIRHSRTFTPLDRHKRVESTQFEYTEFKEIEAAAQKAAEGDLSLLSIDADLSALSETASFRTAPVTPAPETTEEEVVKRIKQLKEQKEQRIRLSLGDGPEDLAPPPKSRSRTPSPMAVKAPVDEKAPLQDVVTNGEEVTPTADENSHAFLDEEPPAPPPTVRTAPLRIGSNGTTPTILGTSTAIVPPAPPKPRPLTPNGSPQTSSITSPSRRNSKLLHKRLVSPTSAETEQKHRRRFSTPVPPVVRMSTFQSDGGDSIDDAVENYLSAARLSQKVKTPLGRVVSFSEVGDPNGSVVFCCVGMGLTRYLTAFYDELATSLNLRLITPDRPGVGGSEPQAEGNDTPLNWPDDVRSICDHLKITKFSILAHSAGAIYALATALRMPQHIRCRVHLLAPWIPPSQMSAIGTHQEPLPASALPYSQRFLRSLPTPFLRAANSNWLSFTSSSVTTSLPRSPRDRSKRRINGRSNTPTAGGTPDTESPEPEKTNSQLVDMEKENQNPILLRQGTAAFNNIASDSRPDLRSDTTMDQILTSNDAKNKTPDYKNRLTAAIWEAATTNANAAVDLIVCLERKQPIGFRYVDITRAVVIHHGSKDSRVPVENAKWLGNMMRRCEVRILEGEGHGLMASAAVMGNVLEEMSKEWEDWLRVVRGKRVGPVSP